jgi:alkanesulfonate monooxygenase SsuD/methylene tetrahydromethanopterin reductase-like flavin-dependent oxidoreductase (luciferase family)
MTPDRTTRPVGPKVDGGIFTDLARVPELAVEIEQCGYDACWTGEISHDPFLPLLLAVVARRTSSRPRSSTAVTASSTG